MYRYILLIFYFVISNNPLFSQENTEERSSHSALKVKDTKKEKSAKINLKKISYKELFVNTDLSILIGSTKFFGDIDDHLPAYEKSNDFWGSKPSLEISLTKIISPLFSLQGTYIMGQFGGARSPISDIQIESTDRIPPHNIMTDPYEQYTGEGDYFVTNYKEIDLQLLLNLSNALPLLSTDVIFSDFMRTISINTNNFTLYLKGGIGINVFNSLNRNLVSDDFIRSYGYKGEQEDWGVSEFGKEKENLINQPKESVYILGLLAKYEVNNKLSLIFDITKRTGTDRWDAFDEGFNSYTETEYDNFNFYSLGVSYTIGKKIEKEKWISPLQEL
jgi:hypothetical protein